jgi:hypothetical protein
MFAQITDSPGSSGIYSQTIPTFWADARHIVKFDISLLVPGILNLWEILEGV